MSTLAGAARQLLRFAPARGAAATGLLLRGLAYGRVDPFRELNDYCLAHRASTAAWLEGLAHRRVRGFLAIDGSRFSRVLSSFLQSPDSRRVVERFTAAPGAADTAFRDILVLKAPGPGERGVVMLKYTKKFELFAALFDLERVLADYYVVLEPCWAGYCDPGILMFVSTVNEVVVQCPEPADFAFIQQLGTNLVPSRLGASDWVDADLFAGEASATKDYDLVMVANWGLRKNHRRLFAALPRVRRRPLSILLIGYAWEGRTAADVRREFAAHDLRDVHLELKERLTAADVAAHLRRSKVFLLLAEKEGSNKAIVEALFTGVPAIVYDGFVGGARTKINPQTGMLSSFRDLASSIDDMCERHLSFTPRAWALAHTGSRNATRLLNDQLRSIATAKGERWTTDIVEKVNRPNMAWASPDALPAEAQTALASGYRRSGC